MYFFHSVFYCNDCIHTHILRRGDCQTVCRLFTSKRPLLDTRWRMAKGWLRRGTTLCVYSIALPGLLCGKGRRPRVVVVIVVLLLGVRDEDQWRFITVN